MASKGRLRPTSAVQSAAEYRCQRCHVQLERGDAVMAMSMPEGLCQRCASAPTIHNKRPSERKEETGLWSSVSGFVNQLLCASSPAVPLAKGGLEELLPRSCISKTPVGIGIGECFHVEVEETLVHSNSVFDRTAEEVLTVSNIGQGGDAAPSQDASTDPSKESMPSPPARLLDGAVGYRLVWSAANWKAVVDDSAAIRSFGVVR